MDVTFSNVLEGTRQYFLGLPKQAQAEGAAAGAWLAGAPPPEEGAPAQSGAPAPSSRPPSAAAAPPPRPPSEPLEPEPHIIHKATVMREAAEKRRERPATDDEEPGAPSPPSHVIRRPPRALPSPAPAPPPDPYARYPYDEPRTRAPPASPQPAPPPRHSPHSYARMSSCMPPGAASRLRDAAPVAPAPSARYAPSAAQPPPQPNDRVPPIHHPPAPPPPHRAPAVDGRAGRYPAVPPRRETSPYGRPASHYDRHPSLPPRKYDPQQAYSGYRPTASAPQSGQSHRVEVPPQVPYERPTADAVGAHYAVSTRPPERPTYSVDPLRHPHETSRRPDYSNMSRSLESRSYHYPTPSTSAVRYAPGASGVPAVPVVQSTTLPSRAVHRPATAPKSNYDYPTPNQVQTSPARSTVKPGYPSQQARMTVSVTTLVNQMNQTKQKRESPLDLSVKTVKNSADSSTTQDDAVDSASMESKIIPLQPRPTSSNRQVPAVSGYLDSHKVDFAPDFTQYRERTASQSYGAVTQQPAPHPVRYNGHYETPRPVPEPHPMESRHHVYPDRSKYTAPAGRADYVPRIDLTRPVADERRSESRIRDDRHFIIEERKRPAGPPIINNIPEKIVRYETWSSDNCMPGRIDRMSQSAQEQHELMRRPVYSYSSHKQFEAYQNEQKRVATSSAYREHHSHTNHRYSYPAEAAARERNDYHAHYHDRIPSSNNRQVIQKIPSHRDVHHPHPHHLVPHSGVPADKRVLSILRNSLETKQTGVVEPNRQARQIPDLIVIDDVDDSVIEITDLTKEEMEATAKSISKPIRSQSIPTLDHHIQMPKAVDSIPRDADYSKSDTSDSKSRSPENDVARIRTKGELKVLPPSQETSMRPESKQDSYLENKKGKLLPKSQKQHLFNQIRQDNLIFESVIKNERYSEAVIPEVKSEPMNIDEIEKDAVIPIKTELILETFEPENGKIAEDDDWASACDNFMEQLKTGCHKKKTPRKRIDTSDRDTESNIDRIPKVEPVECSPQNTIEPPKTIELVETVVEPASIVIKQEPIDEEETKTQNNHSILISEKLVVDKENPEHAKLDTQNSSVQETIRQETADESKKLSTEQEPENAKDLDKPKTLSNLSKSPNKVKEGIKAKKSQKEKGKINKSITLREHKEKAIGKTRKSSTLQDEKILEKRKSSSISEQNDKHKNDKTKISPAQTLTEKDKIKNDSKNEKIKKKTNSKIQERASKDKSRIRTRVKLEKSDLSSSSSSTPIKTEVKEKEPLKMVIKEEPESTDDDEPLIKSKIMKEKEIKYQLLKDLSEKSAYVKLECFDVDMNKNTRISIDSLTKEKDEKPCRGKLTRQTAKTKGKSLSIENNKSEIVNEDSSSNSDDDDLSVASRLRVRKTIKTEDSKNLPNNKISVKSSPSKKQDNSCASSSSTPIRKPGFGDGSDFHPGWEEELYRYKRSLRMPTRLIAIPTGRSGGPFVRGTGGPFTRGSTSLPDLDPAPLSPAPSSAPSAATDDLYARRPDKLTLDSDLESNSSNSAVNRLHYDSEASTSTVFSSAKVKKKSSSIVDVLIQKCGKREDTKKKNKDKDDKTPKVIPKSTTELLATPSLGLLKNGDKGSLSAKKEKLMEDIFYLGAFRKETVTAFRNAFIKNTDGLIGATEEFAPLVLKTRTRTESRVLKQRATIKEVFGDERPASAPPSSCREEEPQEHIEPIIDIKKEPELETKPKLKPKKIIKDNLKRRSSSIRDGLRSTKSLKRNDAKGRLLRLKKRNSLMKSLASKRLKDITGCKLKKDKPEETLEDKDKPKEEGSSMESVEGNTKRRLKRLFGRRKFSSGFDYIRKKKKIIRREDTPNNKIRRPAVKPSPESVHDIQKEIKGWFINKSIGETHLHRAARLGYTDCVAYCLEKMEGDPSAKDNAGFTPLHVASAKGHVRIARLLLQYGANVSAAAQGGIRPLHEASENCHIEIIRLLLSYGADPLLGTYAGQMPAELAEGAAARLLKLHISDVQGNAIEPWRFPLLANDNEELGCNPLSSPPPSSPPPPPDSMVEIQCTEAPLPPFYSLKPAPGQPADGLWCLLQDVTNLLQIKSKDSLLKQIHCGSGSPRELLREIRTQEFLERAQCHQLLCAGEKVNVRASKVALVRVTDKLRQLLKIETVLVS